MIIALLLISKKLQTRLKPTQNQLRPLPIFEQARGDCGVATLKALLESFSILVSKQALRERMNCFDEGASLDDVEEVLKGVGVVA